MSSISVVPAYSLAPCCNGVIRKAGFVKRISPLADSDRCSGLPRRTRCQRASALLCRPASVVRSDLCGAGLPSSAWPRWCALIRANSRCTWRLLSLPVCAAVAALRPYAEPAGSPSCCSRYRWRAVVPVAIRCAGSVGGAAAQGRRRNENQGCRKWADNTECQT